MLKWNRDQHTLSLPGLIIRSPATFGVSGHGSSLLLRCAINIRQILPSSLHLVAKSVIAESYGMPIDTYTSGDAPPLPAHEAGSEGEEKKEQIRSEIGQSDRI